MADARVPHDVWNRFIAASQEMFQTATDIDDEIVVNGEQAAPAPEPLIPDNAGRPLLAWGARVSPVFRERVWWMADAFTQEQGAPFDPNNLMACMAWESGESFAPDKKNMAGSGATGLIQFMPTTAAQLGTTTSALAAMTAEDQLNFVYKYFKPFIQSARPVVSLEDTYMCILWPKGVGKPNSYVVFDKATMATAYRQNAGLDINHDGQVTKFECAALVRDKLTKGLKLAA